MKRRGQTWRELARKLPYAGLPFGLCGTRFGVEEITDWREQEQAAGRPSGLEDFYRSNGLCWPCRSRGYNPVAVDTDGNLPLFDECEDCRGTGARVNPTDDNDVPSPS
ncbi:MAG: hypothetical protein ACLPY1_13490 [Terracidiphilus sp.]